MSLYNRPPYHYYTVVAGRSERFYHCVILLFFFSFPLRNWFYTTHATSTPPPPPSCSSRGLSIVVTAAVVFLISISDRLRRTIDWKPPVEKKKNTLSGVPGERHERGHRCRRFVYHIYTSVLYKLIPALVIIICIVMRRYNDIIIIMCERSTL